MTCTEYVGIQAHTLVPVSAQCYSSAPVYGQCQDESEAFEPGTEHTVRMTKYSDVLYIEYKCFRLA